MYRLFQIVFFFLVTLLCNACSKADASDNVSPNVDDTPITTPAKKLEIASLKAVAMPSAIKEPSDLCYSLSGNSLYTVDDNSGRVFEIDFNANILKTFPTEFGDLEGVCIDPASQSIYISEETTRFIIRLNAAGTPLDTIHVFNSGLLDNPPISENHGIEGLTIHGDTLYLMNQEEPGMYLKYNRTAKTWSGSPLSIGKQSNGKAGSYSALYYDDSDNTLWLLCSKSSKIIHCNLNFEVLDTLDLSSYSNVVKPEGITVSKDHTKIWLVTDDKPYSKFITITLK